MDQRSRAIRFAEPGFSSGQTSPVRRVISLTGVSAFLVVAGVMLAGCAGPNDMGSTAEGGGQTQLDPQASSDQTVVLDEPPSPEQLEVLQDLTVSSEENQKGYLLYKQCLAEAGFTIVEKEPRGALLDFAIPDAAVTSGVDAICYGRHFKYIDMMWQQQNAGDSETVALIRDCLQARGVEPSDDVSQLEGQLRNAGLDPSDCVATH